MTDISANLALPYMAPSQAQKHVTHNEALQILDAVVQLSVVARDQSDPPVAPDAGARYIVGPVATGAWAGQSGRVALWVGNAWIFIEPQTGWRAWVAAESSEVVWSDGLWQPSHDLNNLTGLGINTEADSVNRLAISAPATLLNHEGAGHQLKINKATGGDTASLLFQSGFSGRAEMGLAGSDAWSVKLSDDGTNWVEALSLDPVSGLASGAAVQAGPTDAGVGRLLGVGAFGLGGDTINVTSAELDAVFAGGLYQNTGGIPGQFDDGSRFLHMNDGPDNATQIGFRSGSDIVKWRRKTDGTWREWQEIYSQASIVGPVSQTAGKPTGAIIEQGSNANGSYVRFADGTQHCWNAAPTPGGEITWTHPVAFAAPPVTFLTVDATSARFATTKNRTSTSVKINVWSPDASSAGNGHRALAIGRWF